MNMNARIPYFWEKCCSILFYFLLVRISGIFIAIIDFYLRNARVKHVRRDINSRFFFFLLKSFEVSLLQKWSLLSMKRDYVFHRDNGGRSRRDRKFITVPGRAGKSRGYSRGIRVQ